MITHTYKVKYEADNGQPYTLTASSRKQAARQLKRMSPASAGAVIQVWSLSEWRDRTEPEEFGLDEI